MKIPHALSLGFILLILWLLLSGHYNNLLISLGIFSVFFVLLIAKRMEVVDQESHPSHLNLFAQIRYWFWLIKEIALANLSVCKCILDPKLPISPTIIKLASSQQGDLGRVIYANSITLTPGTVTLEVNDSGLEVHALTREAAEALKTGEMDRRVSALEEPE